MWSVCCTLGDCIVSVIQKICSLIWFSGIIIFQSLVCILKYRSTSLQLISHIHFCGHFEFQISIIMLLYSELFTYVVKLLIKVLRCSSSNSVGLTPDQCSKYFSVQGLVLFAKYSRVPTPKFQPIYLSPCKETLQWALLPFSSSWHRLRLWTCFWWCKCLALIIKNIDFCYRSSFRYSIEYVWNNFRSYINGYN